MSYASPQQLTELTSGPPSGIHICQDLTLLVQVAVVGVITATLFIRTHIHNRTFQDANLIAGFLFFAVIQLYFGGIAGTLLSAFPCTVG